MPDEDGNYTLEDIYIAITDQTSVIQSSLSYIASEITTTKDYVISLYYLFNRVLAMPKSASLISEYFGYEDLDGNGLIFGYDFYITNPPKMLESLVFDPIPTSTMTWVEYLESIL
jgi:hypothetical protein